MARADLTQRLHEYAKRHALTLGAELGAGVHGIVFVAKSQVDGSKAAIKVQENIAEFARERDAYLRLQEVGITQIRGCNVPQLLAFDDELLAIEMTIVSRPFVLDFAGAYLDFPPEYPEEVMAEWVIEKQEQFGHHWGEVQAILRELEGYGAFMMAVECFISSRSFGECAPGPSSQFRGKRISGYLPNFSNTFTSRPVAASSTSSLA
jgi:hypothetical protein